MADTAGLLAGRGARFAPGFDDGAVEPPPRQAYYSISIGGAPVTSTFAPLLVSLEIELTDGGETDRCIITLDDSYGQIQLPSTGAAVSVALGWDDSPDTVVFQGFTDEPKSSGVVPGREQDAGGNIEQLVSQGDRSSGRLLTITAHSADLTSAVKQPFEAHADNLSFGDAAQQFGQKAGLSVTVDPSLSSIQRPYWSMANESFMAWGARIAKEIGASFKIVGSEAVFVPRSGGDTSIGGLTVGGIEATWGVNLISWSIAPVLSRPNFSQFQTRYWDAVQAQWTMSQASSSGTSSSGGSSSVTHTHQFAAPDSDQAQAQAQANSDESLRDRGGADTVTIDGEPAAQPTGSCTVSGIRSGVDGTYTMSKVNQRLVRSGGYTTTCSFVQPGGDAGTDDRSAGGGT